KPAPSTPRRFRPAAYGGVTMLSTQKAAADVDSGGFENRHAHPESCSIDATLHAWRAHQSQPAEARAEARKMQSIAILAAAAPGQDLPAMLAAIPDAPKRHGALLPGSPVGRQLGDSWIGRPISACATVRWFRRRHYQCSPDRKASRERRTVL